MSDFQAAASRQGRSFEELVIAALQFHEWTIDEQHARVDGVEVDIVATAPDGVQWWIECKGSHRGLVPGARRGDTVKKAVAVAWHLSDLPDRKPYMLVTSHLPKKGSMGERMLDKALSQGLFRAVRAIDFDFVTQTDDLPDDEGTLT